MRTYPRAVLICKGEKQSDERNLNLSEAVKIGRAVGRTRPSQSNGIFDCKVLSRNHALLYYENNKFYLKDTGSSNGTFVNSVRLSNSNETSLPKQIYSGDHVQFGVDVTESTKYVTIPCIAASLKLYHPDGSEAKTGDRISIAGLNPNMKYCNLVELTGWLNEARQREQVLRNKLLSLSTILHKAQASSEQSWKAMVEEDILLSRIESLQMKLKSIMESDLNRPDEAILNLWKEVMNLQEDRERYETKAKEAIQNALQEKLDIISKNYELQLALSTSEEQREHYKGTCDSLLDEMKKLSDEHDKLHKELQEMKEKYKSLTKAFESIANEEFCKPPSLNEQAAMKKENGLNEDSSISRYDEKYPIDGIRSNKTAKYFSETRLASKVFMFVRQNGPRPSSTPPPKRINAHYKKQAYSAAVFMEPDESPNENDGSIYDDIFAITKAIPLGGVPINSPPSESLDERLEDFNDTQSIHSNSETLKSSLQSLRRSDNYEDDSDVQYSAFSDSIVNGATENEIARLSEQEARVISTLLPCQDDDFLLRRASRGSFVERSEASLISTPSTIENDISFSTTITESGNETLIDNSISEDESLIFNETVLESTKPVINENDCVSNEKVVEESPSSDELECSQIDEDNQPLSSENRPVPNEAEMETSTALITDTIGESVQNETLDDEHTITNKNNESSLSTDNDKPKGDLEAENNGILMIREENRLQTEKIASLEKKLNDIQTEHENCQITREEATKACDQWKKEYDKAVQAKRACGATFKFFTEKENKFKEDIAQLRTKYEHALVEISQLKALLKEYKNNNLVSITSIIPAEETIDQEEAAKDCMVVSTTTTTTTTTTTPATTDKTIENGNDEMENVTDDNTKSISSCNNIESLSEAKEGEIMSTVSQSAEESEDSGARDLGLDPHEDNEISEFGNNKDRNLIDLDKFEQEAAELRMLSEQYKEDNHRLRDELNILKNEYDLVTYQNKTASFCAIIPLIILSLAIIFAYYPSFSSITGTLES